MGSFTASLGLSCLKAYGILLSSPTRNWTSWIGRWILNHWTIRESSSEFPTVSKVIWDCCLPQNKTGTTLQFNYPRNHPWYSLCCFVFFCLFCVFLYSLFYLRTLYHLSKIPELGLWVVNKCLIDYTNIFYSFPVSFLAFPSFLLKLLSFFR